MYTFLLPEYNIHFEVQNRLILMFMPLQNSVWRSQVAADIPLFKMPDIVHGLAGYCMKTEKPKPPLPLLSLSFGYGQSK